MNKKIPVIKSIIGNWTYYTGVLSFEDISNYVSPINDELHKSKSLSDAIQRSITDNYLSIKEYILNQDERFFNAIVLAVYDGNPNWIEVELEIEGEEFYDIGFLSLSGEEKIFPVDGQHRVEGIRTALLENPELKNEKISVIFIGHKKTQEGMEKSRRLFNTLNRYAKPVSMSDIIALDEDDSSAISTRYLLEESNKVELFKDKRVIFAKQKAIPDTNKEAFTSLITIYQCNNALLKYYFLNVYKETEEYQEYKNKFYKGKRNFNEKDFMKYRPDEKTLQDFKNFNEDYWIHFVENFDVIQDYIALNTALKYRNRKSGGNILFRPIGIKPFVEATLEFKKYTSIKDFSEVFEYFKEINFNLNEKPWRNVVWSPQDGKMATSVNNLFIKNMFLYLVDPKILTKKQMNSLKKSYASLISYDGDLEDIILEELLK